MAVDDLDLSAGLVGHWKLVGDCVDHSGNGNHGENRGAQLTEEGAVFDGRGSFIEVADSPSLRLGSEDFSVAAWVHTPDTLDDALGDILGKYESARRTGFNFSILNYAGVTSSHPNHRNVHFGVDANTEEHAWVDCGRPGNNVFVCALAVHDGSLYAGTFETGADEAGHVYRYAGVREWVDCGSPGPCNSVTSLAVFGGKLCAGASRYRAEGSALPESPNEHPGGRVYRYDGGTKWADCGKLSEEADTVFAMAVFRGDLYAIPIYHQGMYRYDGEGTWAYCGTPGCRLLALGVFKGGLYGAGNTGDKQGGVYRYEGGDDWAHCGNQPGVDQVYSFVTYEGRFYVGTWPDGTVFRYDEDNTWTNCGRLNEECEVMAMAVYNGKLYAGSLPSAEVYRYEGDAEWTNTGGLDWTPDAVYRRAWSMAVYQGKLFCGTLPSGRVHSLEAGKNVTFDHPLAAGWRHLTAVKDRGRLKLYVDGRLVTISSAIRPGDFDFSNDQPLLIGFGAHDYFSGSIKDARIYNRALTDVEIAELKGEP